MTPPTDTPPVTVADPGLPVTPELIQPTPAPPAPPPGQEPTPRTSEKSISTAGMLLVIGLVVTVAALTYAVLSRKDEAQ